MWEVTSQNSLFLTNVPACNLYVDANTVKLQRITAATINFEWFQRPFLLSKLREVKG